MVHVFGRAVRAASCVNCQASLLRIFAGVSGISGNATRLTTLQNGRFQRDRRYRSGPAQNDIPTYEHTDLLQAQVVPAENLEEPTAETNVDAVDEVQFNQTPWYLQVESPHRSIRSISERQKLPDLPEAPPNILQPLLERISIDLGMDDLSLLDLRNLEPPPALGANLIMIIGTARSEKHLHVSADRLCRWLRSEYKLRPHADGLLGRAELKLKLKRKARRLKLLGDSNSERDMDDGVRTGWVCINVGTVEGPENQRDLSPDNAKAFVGFGRRTDGVQIVVQMLVEEKRQEIDLERLWSGIARRQAIPPVELEESVQDLVHMETEGSGSTGSQGSTAESFANSNDSFYTTSKIPFSPTRSQRRGYCSSAKAFSDAAILSFDPGLIGKSEVQQIEKLIPELILLRRSIVQALASGEYHVAWQQVIDHKDSLLEFQNEEWRPYFMQCLLGHLRSLPTESAFEALGEHGSDRKSTPFLLYFYQAMSMFPSPAELECLILLHCFAREIGHIGYDSVGLLSLLKSYHWSSGVLPDRIYMDIIRSLLSHSSGPPFEDSLGAVADIIQNMEDRGHSPLTEEMFLTLHQSIAVIPEKYPDHTDFVNVPKADVTTWNLPTLSPSPLQSRLHTLMTLLHVPFSGDETRMRMLDIYAKQNLWVEFWDFWRLMFREGTPRSAALYAFMFQRVAETHHQKGCMTVLRTWIYDMDAEEPKIRLEGEVLDAVEACLRIADPDGKDAALNIKGVRGEWVNLWRRCARARGWSRS